MRTPTARLLLVPLLAAAVFHWGCLGREARGRMGRLVIWTSHGNDEFEVFSRLMEEFEETFEHEHGRPVEVALSRVPHEGLDTKLKSASLSHTTPDLCRIDVAHVAALAWGSAAVRLDTLPDSPFADLDEVRRHFVPAALSSNLVSVPSESRRLDEGLYAIPEQTNCLVLFRNRALFRARADELRAAGLDPERAPATWEELMRYGAVLTHPDEGVYGFGMENTLWWSLPFLYGAGGDILRPDPDLGFVSAFTSAPTMRAYRFWTRLASEPQTVDGREVIVEGGMWRSGSNKDRAFLEGRLAMVFSGPWNIPTYRARVPEVAASLIPAGPAGTASTVGGNNLAMLRTCVDREAALALLAFVATDEYQERWSTALNQIPTTRRALATRKARADAILRVFMEQMESARARPTIPNSDPLEQAFQSHMELALTGEHELEATLERVDRAVEREVLRPIREAM